MDALTDKTPAGRIPNSPLRNPRHEIIVHATVRGKCARDAGLEAEYKDGPGLDGNVTRILHQPQVRERLAEVAGRAAELAEIHDAWILADMKLFRSGSLEHFMRHDADGRLALNALGMPRLDFTGTTPDQLRCLRKFKHTKYGPEVEVHSPQGFIEMLARHRGLLKPDAVTNVNQTNQTLVVVKWKEDAEANG